MALRCGFCEHLIHGEHDERGQCTVDHPWQCNCPGASGENVYDDEASDAPE